MAGRPQGVKSFVNTDSQDALVATFPNGGNLYSVNISWHGQTIGDRVVIYDAVTNDNTKPKLFDFVIPTAAGSFPAALPSVGKTAERGLFLNPQLSDNTTGKFKIAIGYDGH
jgi:hypothetical protein